MLTPNARISEGMALAGVCAASSNTTTVNSGWIDASNFLRFLAIVGVGTLGSSATLDAKIQQATDSSGTGAKDITGKAITQITTANKQAAINLSVSELDSANSFRYVQLSVTVGTAASVSYGHLWATPKQGAPDSFTTSLNSSTLVQIVN